MFFKKQKPVNVKCISCKRNTNLVKDYLYELCGKCKYIENVPFDTTLHFNKQEHIIFKAVKYWINYKIFNGSWDKSSIQNVEEFIKLRDLLPNIIHKITEEANKQENKREEKRINKERQILNKYL